MENAVEKTLESTYINKKNLLKFIFGSAFGVLMFLVPIPQGESFTTLLDFLKTAIKDFMGVSMNYIIVAILVFSAVMGIVDLVAKPDFIRKNPSRVAGSPLAHAPAPSPADTTERQ